MPFDYETLVNEIYSEVDNKNTRVLSFIRAEIPRQLLELQKTRTLFQESTLEFSTVAGTSEYGPGDAGYPLDALAFDTLYTETGSGSSTYRNEIVGPFAIKDARFAAAFALSGGRPALYAHHHQKTILAPRVTAVHVIKGDYFKDSTRGTDGVLIDTTSTDSTNGWFDRGRTVLRNRVMRQLALQILRDRELATDCNSVAEEGLETLKTEWRLQKGSSHQSPRRLSEDDPTPEENRGIVRF